MSAANTTNQVNLLTILYGKKVANQLHKASRISSRCKKNTKFYGEARTVHITVAPTAGNSASFSKALANQQSTKEVKFTVYRRTEYAIYSVQGELIAAAKGEGAVAQITQLKHQVDAAQKEFAATVGIRAWSIGGGALGVIATGGISSATITLQARGDVVKFKKGMKVAFSDENGTATNPAALRSGGSTLEVLSVNQRLGTVTFNANVSTLADVVAGDFIFRDGDYANAMTGLPGWVPSEDPSSDTFWGVDRTTQGDLTKVSGVRYDGNGGQKEETLIDACAEGVTNDCEDLDTVYVHQYQYRDLLHELGAKRERTSTTDSGISYQYIEVHTPWGKAEVVADKYVPDGYFWITKDQDVELASAGDFPSTLNHGGDGNGGLRTAHDADAVQGRLGGYANFLHENPGNCIAGTW
jgi:hypothetical protein